MLQNLVSAEIAHIEILGIRTEGSRMWVRGLLSGRNRATAIVLDTRRRIDESTMTSEVNHGDIATEVVTDHEKTV